MATATPNPARRPAHVASTSSPTTAKPRFLRLPSVLDRVPFSRPSIYRLMRLGKFPQPIGMGGRAVAWLESDVDAWMSARVKAAGNRRNRLQKSALHVKVSDMTGYKKPRDAASQALIDLRVKMGKTQAAFAVEVLKTAVTTIARYETSHRPPGEVLLRLSDIAREYDPELASKFRIFYLEDVLNAVGNQVTMIPGSEQSGEPPRGYLTTSLAGMDAINGAVAFLKVIEKQENLFSE